MTTFKSRSTATAAKKEFISIKEKSQGEINQVHNFTKKKLSEQKNLKSKMLLQIHDELIFECQKKVAR